MRWKPWFVVLLLVAAPCAARAADVAFPDTPPGRHAAAFFPAFNAGEAAMRTFWTEHGSPASLAQRPVDARLGVWRDMHGEFGTLTPMRVTQATAELVEVEARAGSGSTIRIGFMCDATGLIGLHIEDDGAGGPGPPPDTGPPPTDAQIVAALGAELDSLAKAGEFSGVAMLDKDGTTLFAKACGPASRATNAPNTVDTRFNLGSINKAFTSTAIAQLVQGGKLKLEDPIAKYLPDYPRKNGDRITIRMLLDHRGGVPDVLNNPDLWKDPEHVRTLADWYALVKPMPLDFEPGTKQQYSNGGYVLLGAVIAKVSGEDYYDYIRKHVYAPAGMTRSDHYAIDDQVDNVASAFTRHLTDVPGATAGPDGRAEMRGGHRLGRGSPAGGGYSTAADLVKFAQARRTGVLPAGSLGLDMGIAGGSPGVNALLETSGVYTLVVLSNFDPPAAERFARTAGRMVRRAGGGAMPQGTIVRVGGGSH
jgi:CubicO group peptidase (beta-lactamase class C family)